METQGPKTNSSLSRLLLIEKGPLFSPSGSETPFEKPLRLVPSGAWAKEPVRPPFFCWDDNAGAGCGVRPSLCICAAMSGAAIGFTLHSLHDSYNAEYHVCIFPS